jgi:hypothetical protein
VVALVNGRVDIAEVAVELADRLEDGGAKRTILVAVR